MALNIDILNKDNPITSGNDGQVIMWKMDT